MKKTGFQNNKNKINQDIVNKTDKQIKLSKKNKENNYFKKAKIPPAIKPLKNFFLLVFYKYFQIFCQH